MTARCPDCRRPRATEAEWEAFRAINCDVEDCPWGGDRCWYEMPCGYPPNEVAELIRWAREMRGRRPWTAVPDPHTQAAKEFSR